MDAGLLGDMLRRLVRLAGHVAVVAVVGGLGDVPRRTARENGDALDQLGPVREDKRHVPESLLDELGEIADRRRLRETTAVAPVGEAALTPDAALGREEGGVADVRG